jgi:hypothetical protein
MPDYAGLKAEIALPQYDGMSDAQIALAITTPFDIAVDIKPQDGFDILRRSDSYDWSRLVARAQMPLTGTRAADDEVLVAINVTTAFQASTTPVLRTSEPADLARLQSDMAVLVGVGDVSTTSADAIMALIQGRTTRAQQLGFDLSIHDMEQEIPAARIWTP